MKLSTALVHRVPFAPLKNAPVGAICAGVLDSKTKRLYYANASHKPLGANGKIMNAPVAPISTSAPVHEWCCTSCTTRTRVFRPGAVGARGTAPVFWAGYRLHRSTDKTTNPTSDSACKGNRHCGR